MSGNNWQVNIQEIIPLVEKKSVLWDHRLELFKHKKATLYAWDEICSIYNEAYTSLSQTDRNTYRGTVIRKWRNVKDSWRKNLVKTIRGEKGHKKYVYDKELLFLKQGMKIKLKKKQKPPSTTDTLTGDELSRHSEFQIKSESLNTDFDDENDDSKAESETNETTKNQSDYHNNTDAESIEEKPEFNEFDKNSMSNNNVLQPMTRDKQAVYHEIPSFSFSQSTVSNPAESEISHLFTSREHEDRHVSFIKGVLPSLRNFNERQVLKFQMGVLQLIQSIQENT